MELNLSPRQRVFPGRQPIIVARLAAAAFTLGLGVAFASGTAVAYADSPGSTDSSGVDANSPRVSAKQQKKTTDSDSTDSSAQSGSDEADSEDDDLDASADADDSAEAEAETASDRSDTDTDAEADEAADDVAESVDDEGSPEEELVPEVDAPEEAPADEVTIQTDVEPAAATVEVVAPADDEPNAWAVTVNKVALQLAAAFGYRPSGLTGGNEVPPLRTVLEQGFAALRRTFLSGLPNEAPTARPGQVYQFLSGEVIGDLRAFDLNGNPLKYTVTQGGAHGDVVVNANGTFIYTPSAELARTGGVDSFVVTIDDFTPLVPGSTATGMTVVPVSVRVAPAVGASWRGYDIVNFDGEDVTITKISGNVDWYRGAGVGHVIKENGRFDFQVGEVDTRYNDVYIELTSKSGQVYTVSAKVPHHWTSEKPSVGCATSGGCSPSSQRTGQSATLLGLHSAPTRVVLDANNTSDAQRIADVLKKYCADGRGWNCSFDPYLDEKLIGNEHLLGKPVYNTTDNTQHSDYTEGDIISESDSVKIGAKISGGVLTKLAALINLEITTEYQHTWTRTHTFQQKVSVTIAPHHVASVFITQPIYRTWGNFTVQMGNTTYELKNIYFDSPRTDNDAPVGGYVIKYDPWPGAAPAGATVLGESG